MAQSNIYAAGTADILSLFSDYVDGSSNRIALALSHHPVNDATRSAIGKSLNAFGYGDQACSFATLQPRDTTAGDEGVSLDPQSLFILLEALDPLLVICCDKRTADLLGSAYRTTYRLDAPARVFGRSAVMFRDLASLMDSEAGKQKAWKLLKTLPRR